MNIGDIKPEGGVKAVPHPLEDNIYLPCSFCATVLKVSMPWKRSLDPVVVKCGHCSNFCFLTTGPPPPPTPLHPHTHLTLKSFNFLEKLEGGCSRKKNKEHSSSSPESVSSKQIFAVKPPKKNYRLPSAYNCFMKEEIQRLKAANPEIPHKEAFTTAAKNWARYSPSSASATEDIKP